MTFYVQYENDLALMTVWMFTSEPFESEGVRAHKCHIYFTQKYRPVTNRIGGKDDRSKCLCDPQERKKDSLAQAPPQNLLPKFWASHLAPITLYM
jgi:hypothetical protein